VTFPDEVLRRLERAKTLPEAVTIARIAAGSHDKLGRLLGAKRQTIIKWEKGTYPTQYRDQLIAIGVPAKLLTTVDRTAIEKRLRRVEAEVASIRRDLG
jgi:DNA-binding XRE family transcriptional regulator